MKAFWEFLKKDPLRKLLALSLTIVLYAPHLAVHPDKLTYLYKTEKTPPDTLQKMYGIPTVPE